MGHGLFCLISLRSFMLGFSISMAEAEECILLELLQFKRLARGKKSPLAKAMQSIIINDCIFF